MNHSFDVAVIGLGPVGSTCAALLGSLGVRTLAIERSRRIYDRPRAFALDHEVMRIFEDIGVAEAVAPHTAPFTPSEYYGAEGQLIKRLGALPPPWPLGWPPSMVFEQPPVEALLRKRAGEVAEVRYDELLKLDLADDYVRLHLRGSDPISVRYVVGCDGAASTVRNLVGIEYEDLAFDQEWLVADLRVNERGLAKLPPVSIQYCEPARPSTYLVGVGSHRRWELMLHPGETNPDPWKLLARWITPDDAELWRAAAYRFHALVARDWRCGRVFIAGDAAHQQPPFTGQGMCQGIRDVANLSWKLHYVLALNAADKLLDTYEQERKQHVKRLTGVIKEIGQVIGERDPKAARERDRRLLEEAGGNVVTVPRQNLIPPLEGGFRSESLHSAIGTLFPKDGARGMRVVVKPQQPDPILYPWFERWNCLAAIVRPDHYVFGIANSNPALDRTLKGMAEQLSDATP